MIRGNILNNRHIVDIFNNFFTVTSVYSFLIDFKIKNFMLHGLDSILLN